MTQEDSLSLVMVQVQALKLMHRQIRVSMKPRRDGESRKAELRQFHTDEKNPVGSHMGDRTANRHR